VSVSIERQVLRYLFTDRDVYGPLITEGITSDLFTEDALNPSMNRYAILYEITIEYYSRYSTPITREVIESFATELSQTPEEAQILLGAYDEVQIVGKPAPLAYLIDALRIQYRKYTWRRTLDESAAKYSAGDIEGSIQHTYAGALAIENVLSTREKVVSLSQGADARLTAYSTPTKPGVQTGFHTLDKVTHGLYPGNLVVVAAGTGEGKTTFIQNIAYNAWVYNSNVLYITIENSASDIIRHMDALAANIEHTALKRGTANSLELDKLRGVFTSWSNRDNVLDIVHKPECRISFVESKLRDAKKKYNLLIIDYMQILSLDGAKSRIKDHTYFADLAVAVRALGDKYGVPVITPSQVNRTGAQTKSGAYGSYTDAFSQFIANTADIRISLRATDPEAAEVAPLVEIEAVLTKHRDGARTKFQISANFARSKMVENSTPFAAAPTPVPAESTPATYTQNTPEMISSEGYSDANAPL